MDDLSAWWSKTAHLTDKMQKRKYQGSPIPLESTLPEIQVPSLRLVFPRVLPQLNVPQSGDCTWNTWAFGGHSRSK